MKFSEENKNDLNMVLKRVNISCVSNISRFEGNFYKNGRKHSASRDFFHVLRELKRSTGKPAFEILSDVVRVSFPYVAIRAKKVGGATYKIPVHLYKEKEVPLAIKTLVRSSYARRSGDRISNLLRELSLSLRNEGSAVHKRNTLHLLAFNNRAYVKYL
jgi:small subunit ribosomal protein S7